MEHVRLPNGFGQITKLKKKNLRHPYRAMVTTGKRPDGKYNRKAIGYFDTYEEAYEALKRHHERTFRDLFTEWFEYNSSRLSYPKMYLTAISYCKDLFGLKLSKITDEHIDMVLGQNITPTIRDHVYFLLIILFDYARANGYITEPFDVLLEDDTWENE